MREYVEAAAGDRDISDIFPQITLFANAAPFAALAPDRRKKPRGGGARCRNDNGFPACPPAKRPQQTKKRPSGA